MTKYNLFLDDIRFPKDAWGYTKFYPHLESEWEIARNYEQFVEIIEEKGMPDLISFDHDLADSHYTPSHLWSDYDKSKEWQEQQVHSEKTGYDCAKWLVNYCLDNNVQLPKYFVHSMNPVGLDNILGLLNSFSLHQTKN